MTTDKIVLNCVATKFDGVAYVKLWGGSTGFVKMHPKVIEVDDQRPDISKIVNDGGYGAEDILAAIVYESKLYSEPTHDFSKSPCDTYSKTWNKFYWNDKNLSKIPWQDMEEWYLNDIL